MILKVIEQTETGLNTKFTNIESGRNVDIEHVIEQIKKGNKNYSHYQAIHKANGTVYVRSKADKEQENNIE